MLAAVVLWRSQTHPECSVSPVGRACFVKKNLIVVLLQNDMEKPPLNYRCLFSHGETRIMVPTLSATVLTDKMLVP